MFLLVFAVIAKNQGEVVIYEEDVIRGNQLVSIFTN